MNKVYVSMTNISYNIDNRFHKLIIICDNLEQAKTIKDIAEKLSNMKYVNIRMRKPHYNDKFYYIQFKNADYFLK